LALQKYLHASLHTILKNEDFWKASNQKLG